MSVTNINRGREMRLRILVAIREHIAEYGWAPTIREIGAAVGLSAPSTVLEHLRNLEREGKLVLGGGPRMIRLL